MYCCCTRISWWGPTPEYALNHIIGPGIWILNLLQLRNIRQNHRRIPYSLAQGIVLTCGIVGSMRLTKNMHHPNFYAPKP